MSRFAKKAGFDIAPYTPGEQPKGREYVKLNTNESPFPPSPAVIRAIEGGEASRLNLYSDPTVSDLNRAIAQRFSAVLEKEGKPPVSPEQVFSGNGSDEVLAFAFRAFCTGGVGAAFPVTGYGFYPVFAEFFGVPYKEVPMKNRFFVDVARFDGLKETVVIANPNAQTGVYLPLSDIETLLLQDRDRLVIVDEAYCDFGGESAVKLLDAYDNLLVVMTMSKSRQLAGGRLGFAIGSKELVADLNGARYGFNPYNIGRLGIVAGIAAISDEEYFVKTTSAVIAERKRLSEELVKLGFELTPSLANFVLAGKEGLDGKELYLALKERGVLVRWLGGDIADRIRITVGSREQNDALIAAIKDVFKEKGI